MSMHYHLCPECLERYNCDQDCTLQDATNSLGANIVCALCEDLPTPKEEEMQPESFQEPIKEPEMTQEQFARYNGFIR